jgi:hypothetical protein
MDTTIEKELIDNLERRAERRADRRKAILLGGAALAGLAITSKMGRAQSTVTDADVLNFALNLEYLEAQFYTLATAGVFINDASLGLSIDASDGSAKGGTVVTKAGSNVAISPVPFTTPVLKDYANETAKEERNHVAFLQAGLKGAGAVAVAMPNIDLFNSFNTLANAAGLGATFDPFVDERTFLLGAFIFEDVGVTAYNGAAGLLTSKSLLQAAAGILAVEAYHAGSIRIRIYAAGATVQAASQKIAAARAALSAAGGATATDDVGVGNDSTGAATIVDADANGITFARNTQEVLSIVYGGGKGGGVFYPNGLNGTIK